MHGHPRASSQRDSRRDGQVAQGVVDDGFDGFADKGLDQQRLGFLLGKAAGAQIEQEAFVECAGGGAMAAGASSAKISSSGLLSASASSDSSNARVIILASVFCASGRTMMRPWNTEWARSSTTARKTSRLEQFGTVWSMNSVVSACWLAVEQVDAVGLDLRAFARRIR